MLYDGSYGYYKYTLCVRGSTDYSVTVPFARARARARASRTKQQRNLEQLQVVRQVSRHGAAAKVVASVVEWRSGDLLAL